jgi:hypothetical protein
MTLNFDRPAAHPFVARAVSIVKPDPSQKADANDENVGKANSDPVLNLNIC